MVHKFYYGYTLKMTYNITMKIHGHVSSHIIELHDHSHSSWNIPQDNWSSNTEATYYSKIYTTFNSRRKIIKRYLTTIFCRNLTNLNDNAIKCWLTRFSCSWITAVSVASGTTEEISSSCISWNVIKLNETHQSQIFPLRIPPLIHHFQTNNHYVLDNSQLFWWYIQNKKLQREPETTF